MSPLNGVRVVDWSHGISGPFAARILGDLGAEVIKIESESHPDPARAAAPVWSSSDGTSQSLMFQYLNWGKKSCCLDADDPADRQKIESLIRHADIVIESHPPGYLGQRDLGFEQLIQWNPRLVLVSVTPFGQTGPYANYLDSDLILQAMGGIMRISGRVDLPPLKHGLDQSYFCGALNAAYTALAAYRAAKRDGIGEHVDLSLQACLASELVLNQPMYTFVGAVQNRRAVVQDPFAGEPIATGHGYVSFQTGGGASIDTLASVLGDDRFRDPNYASGVYRIEHAEQIYAELSNHLKTAVARDVFLQAADRRLLAGFVQTAPDFLSCPQLAARDYFVSFPDSDFDSIYFPKRLFGLSAAPERSPQRAPFLGEHTKEVFESTITNDRLDSVRFDTPDSPQSQPNLPYKGLKVLDLSTVFAVPYIGGLLSDLGADVIKIEAPGRVDQSRKPTAGPYLDNEPGSEPWNVSGMFYVINRGKRSMSIDLSLEQGQQVLRDLIRNADVLLENFTPRVLKKWGLDYESIKALNPELILLSNTGYGQTGPWANYPTQGTTLESTMGIANYTGYRGDKPWKVGQSYPDFVACWSGLTALAAALIQRDATGNGQAIDLSMYEAGIALIGKAILNYQVNGSDLTRIGNEDYELSPSNIYPCLGTDHWVAITVQNDAQWQALLQVTGVPSDTLDLKALSTQERLKHRVDIDQLIAHWAAQHDRFDIFKRLQLAGVPCGPVLDARDLLECPQLKHRGFYEWLDHGGSIGKKPLIGRPYRLLYRPLRIPCRAPTFGEHNRAVLLEELHYSVEQVEKLYGAGVIHDKPTVSYTAAPLPLKAMCDLGILRAVYPSFKEDINRLFEPEGGRS